MATTYCPNVLQSFVMLPVERQDKNVDDSIKTPLLCVLYKSAVDEVYK